MFNFGLSMSDSIDMPVHSMRSRVAIEFINE